MVSFSNPDGVHAPHGLYSHTATVPADTELVFVSGQVGVLPDGSTPGVFVAQLTHPRWFIEVEAVAARPAPRVPVT